MPLRQRIAAACWQGPVLGFPQHLAVGITGTDNDNDCDGKDDDVKNYRDDDEDARGDADGSFRGDVGGGGEHVQLYHIPPMNTLQAVAQQAQQS